MFNPALIRDSIRAMGLTVPVDATIGGVPHTGVNVKWWQPDALYADGLSQQTDYHIEYWTEDLPGLKKGDEVLADGAVYEVADTPAFAIGKSGGHYSQVRLRRTARSYPKVAITRGAPSP